MLCAILLSCEKGLYYPDYQKGEAPTQPEGLDASDFDVKVISAEMMLKYNMDPGYYAKYTKVWGIPIVASHEVDDIYLQNAAELVGAMLSDESLVADKAVEIRNLLFKEMFRIILYPDNGKYTTQVPEFKTEPAVSGYGANPDGQPFTVAGILGLVECPEGIGKNDAGRAKQGNTLVHEVMHSIHEIVLTKLLPDFNDKLKTAYQNAQNTQIWKADSYINTNHMEYLARGAEVWFNWQPNISNRKNGEYIKQDELGTVDSQLYDVLGQVFQSNTDVMEHLSFASPKVQININPAQIGLEYSELKIELLGGTEVIREASLITIHSQTFIMPDPRVSYVSFDNYKFRATILTMDGEQEIKEFAFTKEELIAMEGFPSDINLTGRWVEVN